MPSEIDAPKRWLRIFIFIYIIYAMSMCTTGLSKGKREGYFPTKVQYKDGWIHAKLYPWKASRSEGYTEVYSSPYFLDLRFLPNKRIEGTVKILNAKLLDTTNGKVKEETIDDYDEFSLSYLGGWEAFFSFGGFQLEYIDYSLIVNFEIEDKKVLEKNRYI